MGSVEFASLLVREANGAVSPGVGFGPGNEGSRVSLSSRTSNALVRRSETSEALSIAWVPELPLWSCQPSGWPGSNDR